MVSLMNAKTLIYVAASALAIVGCAKEINNDDVIASGNRVISFQASFETTGQTKTVMGDVTAENKVPVYWVEGDKVAAFVNESALSDIALTVNAEDATKASSTVDFSLVPDTSGDLVVVYPSEGTSYASANVSFNLPADQYTGAGLLPVDAEGNAVAAAVAYAGDLADLFVSGMGTLSFKNAFSVLKFNVVADNIASVTFKGNSDEVVAGTYAISKDAVVGDVTDPAKEIVLRKSDKSAFEPGAYYMVIAPQTFSAGFTLTFVAADGTPYEKSTDKEVVFKRSQVVGFTAENGDVAVVKVSSKAVADLQFARTLTECCVGFCGHNLFAMSDGNVYDLEYNKVGTLNLEGVAGADKDNFEFVGMSNDSKGVLVATTGTDASGNVALGTDDYVNSYTYAWLDGYENAPTLIRKVENSSPNKQSNYFSVTGDLKNGPYVFTCLSGGRGTPSNHHHFYGETGLSGDFDASGATWSWFSVEKDGNGTAIASNDGNWGQMVSAASAVDVNILNDGSAYKSYFVWDSAAAWSAGQNVYIRYATWTALWPLSGSCQWDGVKSGTNGFGNYTLGHIRAFMFDGAPCVAVGSSGGACAFFSVQRSGLAEGTLYNEAFAEGAMSYTCCAYYYDETAKAGNILYVIPGSSIVHYRIGKSIK